MKAGTFVDVINSLVVTLKPQFDPNRNDIWSKRMNTLRKFVMLVSKWIIRKRVEKRMLKVLFYFHENNAFSREEARKFIEEENANARTMSVSQNNQKKDAEKEKEKLLLTQGLSGEAESNANAKDALDTSIKTINQFSFTEVFFTEMAPIKLRYEECQEVLLQNRLLIKAGKSEVDPSMLRRNLFPEFNQDLLSASASQGVSLPKKPLSEYLKPDTFNDYSFYHLKTKPHFITINYQPFDIPKIPVYFPPDLGNQLRQSGFEEDFQRKGANIGLKLSQYERISQQNLSSNGLLPDPLIAVSEKALALLDEDVRKKEKPKRVIIPQSQYTNLVHDIYKGNLDMNLLKRNSTIVQELIGDEAMPPWLAVTRVSSRQRGAKNKSPKKTVGKPTSLPKLRIPTQLKISWNRFDLDFFSHFPQFRKFLPALPFDESKKEWILRPPSSLRTSSNQLLFQLDDSLRSKWIYQHFSGFLSANYYLLGATESCWRDGFIPNIGPTLNDYYFIDSDRHYSGLHCFKNDFSRDTNEWDGDVEFLQKKLAPVDYLTDSESDEEDEIDDKYKPSMRRVKRILKPAKKAAEAAPVAAAAAPAKGGKGKAPAPAAAVAAPAKAEEEEDDEKDAEGGEGLTKKEEQVELLRDRKVLDLEATYKKSRQFLFQNMSKKLLEISQENNCILFSLPIPLSFHEFEYPVYQLMNSMLPELNNSLIEYDHRAQAHTLLPTDTSLTLTNNFSPAKNFNKYQQFNPNPAAPPQNQPANSSASPRKH